MCVESTLEDSRVWIANDSTMAFAQVRGLLVVGATRVYSSAAYAELRALRAGMRHTGVLVVNSNHGTVEGRLEMIGFRRDCGIAHGGVMVIGTWAAPFGFLGSTYDDAVRWMRSCTTLPAAALANARSALRDVLLATGQIALAREACVESPSLQSMKRAVVTFASTRVGVGTSTTMPEPLPPE